MVPLEAGQIQQLPPPVGVRLRRMLQDRRLRAPVGVHEAQHRPRRRHLRARPRREPREDGRQGGDVPHQGLRLRREGRQPRRAAAAARGGGARDGGGGGGGQEALLVAAGSRSEMADSGLVMIGGATRVFREFSRVKSKFRNRRGLLLG
ncbi:hypothetical protein EUGRSUZ_A02041 [Eucalyptus grandis]|uniref:Uncharacterized protein n=2 Tax=Eucalyptus grandis TaxID=71139 RepID=A0ACC3M5Z7_EUCGR|nr:hypothetical protein EUGRSUZ_A02041 [Eucalyptus grandis]